MTPPSSRRARAAVPGRGPDVRVPAGSAADESTLAGGTAAPVRLVHVTTVPESLEFLQGQARYMAARGVEIHAVSSPGESLDRFGAREGVPVHPVAMARRITPASDARSVARIWRLLRRLRPAIVHAHTPKGGLLGMAGAWLARVPVRVYHIHGLPMMTAGGTRRLLLRASERVACRLATQVLCVSHSIREVAVAEGLCPAGKVRVLHNGSINGIDALARFAPASLPAGTRQRTRARFGIPSEAPVLGYVGRLVRDKGVVELAEAWRVLREEFPELHLLVVGPFEPQDPVPADVQELLRSDPRVHLAGMDWNTPPLFAAMDVVALPTYREGFPVVPLEAAAMAVPVVATTIPGCVEAVQDGVTGSLVPPRDPQALAAAVRRYVADEGVRRAHGQAARERVLRSFRQEDVWRALFDEYRSLLARSAPAAGQSWR